MGSTVNEAQQMEKLGKPGELLLPVIHLISLSHILNVNFWVR